MLKTKRKTAKTYSCITCFQQQKVKEGPDYICFCPVFGQLPQLGKTFVPLRFIEHALLVTPRANMNESSL